MRLNKAQVAEIIGVVAVCCVAGYMVYNNTVTMNKFESELNNYVYSDKLHINQETAETATGEQADIVENIENIEYTNAINIVNSGSVLKVDGGSTFILKATSQDDTEPEIKVDNVDIVNSDQVLKVDGGSAFKLEEAGEDAEHEVHEVKFNIDYWGDQSYTVDYDRNSSSMLVDNLVSIRLLADKDVADATAEFVTDLGEIVVSGQKTITDSESGDKMVVQAVAKLVSSDADKKEAIQSAIDTIINSADIVNDSNDDKISISVNGMTTKSKLEDMSNFILTSRVAEIENSETGDIVYCSPYSKGLTGSGLDKTVTIGEKSLKYGNISDSNTGYMPFILDSNIKIAAKSSDSLKAIFE